MSLLQEQHAFSRDLVKLLEYCFSRGYEVSMGEVQRTVEQQQIYVRSGRSKTMASNHLRKCAADLFIFFQGRLLQTKQELQEIGDFWQSLDPKNSWGGNWNTFKDCPHFERRP